MATMEVGTQDEANRIIASVFFDNRLMPGDLTGTIPISAIKYLVLIDPYRLLLTTSFNVFHKSIEGLAIKGWEDFSEGVRFKGFGHCTLPSLTSNFRSNATTGTRSNRPILIVGISPRLAAS
jgi:hypothetical protein